MQDVGEQSANLGELGAAGHGLRAARPAERPAAPGARHGPAARLRGAAAQGHNQRQGNAQNCSGISKLFSDMNVSNYVADVADDDNDADDTDLWWRNYLQLLYGVVGSEA